MSYSKIIEQMRLNASFAQSELLSRFFKTGKGQYGEGDIFYGIKVPVTRIIASQNLDLNFLEIMKLLKSKMHEERLCALLILVKKFKMSSEEEKKIIFNFYLANTERINNWDLVDLSSDKIVGKYLLDKDKSILLKLAESENLWERRISIISTFEFIRNHIFEPTFKISRMLLHDDHDLIHKAVGWMLREVGKRNIDEEEIFLKPLYNKMPRTMLRYAIEKFPENKRQLYLKGKI